MREIRSELGPDASPEQITQRMEEIAEDRGRRRLTARVRRVMGPWREPGWPARGLTDAATGAASPPT